MPAKKSKKFSAEDFKKDLLDLIREAELRVTHRFLKIIGESKDNQLFESRVCSLSISKQLKAAGYPQEGHSFYWRLQSPKPGVVSAEIQDFSTNHLNDKSRYVASPLSSEIGELLPRTIRHKGCLYSLMSFWPVNYSMKDEIRLSYEEGDWEHGFGDDDMLWSTDDKNEANARAKMWLFLKKNNLLPEEEND